MRYVARRRLAGRSTRLSFTRGSCFATHVTRDDHVMEFLVLGPLEVRVGPEVLQLGGGKQRAVLAALLLRAGEVVSVDQLVDELWDETPPASAAHTLEVYVSRLRQLLNGHGPVLHRRGSGYMLELGSATLDACTFVKAAEDVSAASAEGDHASTVRRATAALAIWRGSALADVAVGPLGRAETERLEELRLRTLELRIDSELALGRHDHAVGELQPLIARNPYRERFVAQLMLALYRSGRHVEALDVYEQTRRRLDDDLGLQPSADLQQLSAQIVRQEPALRAAAAAVASSYTEPPRSPMRGRAQRLAGLVAAGIGVAVVMALTATGGARQLELASRSSTTRVALVVQSIPAADRYDDWRRHELTGALDGLRQYGDTEAQLFEVDDDLTPSEVERITHRLAAGRFDLVLFALNADGARAVAPHVGELQRARSVVHRLVDSRAPARGSRATPRRSASRPMRRRSWPVRLAGSCGPVRRRPDTQTSSPLWPVRRRRRRHARSLRSGEESRERCRSAKFLVDYTNEMLDPTACERVANAQIDAGSDVVFAHSGRCGTGALAVARTRGVWAISGDGVGEPAGNVLAAIFKDWDNAVYTAAGRVRRRNTSGRRRRARPRRLQRRARHEPHASGGNRVEGREPVLRHSAALGADQHCDARRAVAVAVRRSAD